MSISSKGVDLRIEELKSQNRQLLEELFTLRKACESKEEELAESKEKVPYIDCSVRTCQRHTVFSQLNAPGVYIKLSMVDQAFR